MAYAEKVPSPSGDYFRGRYKDPEGKYVSVRAGGGDVVRYAKKADAKKAAEDQESDVRNGRWRDPAAGQILFRDWANEWYQGLELSWSTMVNYKRHLEDHLLPFFGETALIEIDQALIVRWKRREKAAGYAADSIRTWHGTLHNVLDDSVPRHIAANPAARKRGKGKRSGRKTAGRRERDVPIVSPLGSLLIAERMSILTGRDDEFVMVCACFWCALRMGEMIGLETRYLRGPLLKVEHQLYEIEAGDNEELRQEAPGGFLKCPPKDDSYRDVRLPPFMRRMLDAHVERTQPEPCRCHGFTYAFGGWGTPIRQRGTVPVRDVAAVAGVSEGSVRAVIGGKNGTRVGDATRARVEEAVRATGWEPVPGAGGRAWHWRRSSFEEQFGAAASAKYPARDGQPAHAVALAGEWPGRRVKGRNRDGRAEWCWLPVADGMHPHLLRHSVKTWMEQVRTPEVLSEEVLGHEIPGVSGTYRHVSPEMRAGLAAAQSAAWESALDARLEMSEWSPVGILRELLSERLGTWKPHLVPRDSPGTNKGVLPFPAGTPSDLRRGDRI